MSIPELHDRIIKDLESIGIDTEGFNIVFYDKYCKSFYGKYFPKGKIRGRVKENPFPVIKIYPYKNTKLEFYSYDRIFKTAIHEACHHLQVSSPGWKRKRGVMHNCEFYKLLNFYENKWEEFKNAKAS